MPTRFENWQNAMTLRPSIVSNAARFAAMVVCLLALAGCQPHAVAISGTVTLDGAPLDEAMLMLVPAIEGPKKVMARIVGGSYAVPAERGLEPGEYRVEVVDDPRLAPPTAGMAAAHAPPAKRRAFPYHYSDDSPLRIHVKADAGPQVFDFQLKSGPPTHR